MKISIFTTTSLLLSTLNLGLVFSATAQGLFDMPGQEHIDRGTMDRNRRSRGQHKTLWEDSAPDSIRPAEIDTAGNNANIRTGPGFNYRVVTQVRNGRSVNVIGNTADGQWTQLRCGNCPPEVETWIYSDFIKMR